MAFLGKEYTFVSQENFEAYIKAIDIPEPDASNYATYTPTLKLEKDGGNYKFYAFSPQFNREIVFKSGEEIDETTVKYSSKTTFTVDGNIVKKVQKISDGVILTTTKEYSGDSMVETFTSSKWDGAAKRFYKA